MLDSKLLVRELISEEEIIEGMTEISKGTFTLSDWLHPQLNALINNIAVPKQALCRIYNRAYRIEVLQKPRFISKKENMPPDSMKTLPLEEQLIWEWRYRWALRYQRSLTFWENILEGYTRESIICLARKCQLDLILPSIKNKTIRNTVAAIIYNSEAKPKFKNYTYRKFLKLKETYKSIKIHKYTYTVCVLHGKGYIKLTIPANSLQFMEIGLLLYSFKSYTLIRVKRRANEQKSFGEADKGTVSVRTHSAKRSGDGNRYE